MAGHWLQIDCDLPEKPETQTICDSTGLPIDIVVGRLVMFWRWVDRHATSDCVRHVSVNTLIRVAGGDDTFWKCVASVGWLVLGEESIQIPGWGKRFSKSAKSRMLDAKRKAETRRKNVRPKADKCPKPTGPKEEKRREEKSKEEKNTNTNAQPPAASPYSPDFEAFWKAYPRHVGKSRANKAWQLAVKGLSLRAEVGSRENAMALILEAALLFAPSLVGQSGQFCPHPESWLNSSRFEDDPAEWNRTDERNRNRDTAASYQPNPGQKYVSEPG